MDDDRAFCGGHKVHYLAYRGGLPIAGHDEDSGTDLGRITSLVKEGPDVAGRTRTPSTSLAACTSTSSPTSNRRLSSFTSITATGRYCRIPDTAARQPEDR